MKIPLYVIISILVLFLVYLAMICPWQSAKRRRKFASTALLCPYAHRGLHGSGIPENSLEAFKAAVENGYGIELDIQLSIDGEVMVFHDYTLDRMTGVAGALSEKTAEELNLLRLAGTSSHIPTLKEVLTLVDGRVPLLIELKGESTDTSLPPRANEILRGYTGEYCIESFNPILVAWYRKNRPEIMRGQLYTNVCREKKASTLNILLTLMMFNFIAQPDFVAFDHKYSNSPPLKLVLGVFKPLRFTWTIRDNNGFDVARKTKAKPIFEGELPSDFAK